MGRVTAWATLMSWAQLKRRKALVAIVDDDESIRHATRDLLRAAGFSTATYEDAESFLDSESRASVAWSSPTPNARHDGTGAV